MPTDLVPVTRHSVVCGLCDAEAVCPTEMIVRNIVSNVYLGTDVIEASVAIALPPGWSLRDFVHEVCFVCPDCVVDKVPQHA